MEGAINLPVVAIADLVEGIDYLVKWEYLDWLKEGSYRSYGGGES